MKIRVGFGYDVHPLHDDCDFWLGGVNIPHTKGAKGHSDADTLIHAICDALLGAASLRDIGCHFPDTSSDNKDKASILFLKEITQMLSKKGFFIGNVDATICLQNPKISTFIPEMKKILSIAMNVNEDDVSIKATTTERLGFVGKEQGVAVYAVVLISK